MTAMTSPPVPAVQLALRVVSNPSNHGHSSRIRPRIAAAPLRILSSRSVSARMGDLLSRSKPQAAAHRHEIRRFVTAEIITRSSVHFTPKTDGMHQQSGIGPPHPVLRNMTLEPLADLPFERGSTPTQQPSSDTVHPGTAAPGPAAEAGRPLIWLGTQPPFLARPHVGVAFSRLRRPGGSRSALP